MHHRQLKKKKRYSHHTVNSSKILIIPRKNSSYWEIWQDSDDGEEECETRRDKPTRYLPGMPQLDLFPILERLNCRIPTLSLPSPCAEKECQRLQRRMERRIVPCSCCHRSRSVIRRLRTSVLWGRWRQQTGLWSIGWRKWTELWWKLLWMQLALDGIVNFIILDGSCCRCTMKQAR